MRLRASISRPVSHQRMGSPISETDTGYKLGQRVRHSKFGEGTIVNPEGSGEHSRLQVAFRGRDQMAGGSLCQAGKCNFQKISLFCNNLLALYVEGQLMPFSVPLR